MSETTRRDALKMLAAGSIAASAACTRDERHERDGTKAQPAATSEHQAMSRNPVIEQMALPSTGPWPTTDPFLFCVHHNDRYPRANGSLGPASPLAGRHLGLVHPDVLEELVL